MLGHCRFSYRILWRLKYTRLEHLQFVSQRREQAHAHRGERVRGLCGLLLNNRQFPQRLEFTVRSRKIALNYNFPVWELPEIDGTILHIPIVYRNPTCSVGSWAGTR